MKLLGCSTRTTCSVFKLGIINFSYCINMERLKVRGKLENKDNMEPEAIKEAVNDLQQSSLKVS